MKLLVIDTVGMVGHVVAIYMKEQGHEVVGINETSSDIVKTIVGSLFDTNLFANEIKKGSYNAVINCSAIINQDAEADKSKAAFINSYLPHFLEKITSCTDTVLVHRSTDCIFSGNRGQYALDDFPDAPGFYARSKALGEVINDKDITIRTSLIGPEYDYCGNGLFNWFYNQKGDVSGFANAFWTGLTTIEFAREIEKLLFEHAHGLFQLVPDHAITKHDLLLLFEKYFTENRNVIKVENKLVDKSLIQCLNGYEVLIPDYEEMIKDMANWINNHKKLYTNYK